MTDSPNHAEHETAPNHETEHVGRSRHQRMADIFGQVRGLTGSNRAEALGRLCGVDGELIREIEALLASDSVDDFLGDTRLERDPQGHPDALESIAGYRVLGMLGEGGMGVVYEAQQERPNRRVALKVIRSALADEGIRQRFNREADALGRLKHPGIAQVYEVGVDSERGVPFIAMELVEGEPLTAYASARELTTRDRLGLGVKLCEAIEHAHQRGVIHRDLKPANILVTADGEPKVLDFGVARMTENDVNAATMQTQAGQVIGTAAYMSPEQASADQDRVDTRSDVYALGVVIFELLAGRLPIVVDRLPLPDAIRAIREAEPTRIGSLDTSLRGDIDTILSKALERDPARRYQMASELAAEIRRHLADEPIVAHPPSTIYQLRKFARRNKALVGASCAVSVAVVLGFAATGLALAREATALDQAEASLERASESSVFLRDVLLSLDPAMAEGRDTELLMLMLDRAEERVDEELDTPGVRAEMLTTIGRARYVIFDYPEAAALLDRAHDLYRTLDAGDPALEAEARLIHADAYYKSGDQDRAQELLRTAIGAFERDGDEVNLAQATRQLGEIIMEEGRDPQTALDLYTRSLALSGDSSDEEVGRVHLLIGMAQRRLELFDESRASYEEALRLFRAADVQVEVGMALSALGLLTSNLGDHEGGIAYYQEAIAVRTAVDPRPNPQISIMLSNIGRMMNRLERYDEAEDVLRRSLAMHIDLHGSDHFTVGFPSITLGETLSAIGRHEEALAHLDRGVDLISEHFGAASPAGVSMRSRRVSCHLAAGRHKRVIDEGEQCLALIAEAGVDEVSFGLGVLEAIAESHGSLGDRAGQIGALERALALAEGEAVEGYREQIRALSD